VLNKVQLIGNLGRDPESRYTPTGKQICQFSVAVDGGSKDKTEWVNVEAWEKTAENCTKYIQKGSKVYIEGRLKTDSWLGNDGQKKYKTGVVAARVIFLDKRDASSSQGQPQGQQDEFTDVPFTEDEMPF